MTLNEFYKPIQYEKRRITIRSFTIAILGAHIQRDVKQKQRTFNNSY